MQDPAEQVGISILDRLLLEEIVRHELDLDAVRELGRTRQHGGKILYNDLELGELGSQRHGNVTVRTTNVDNGSRFAELVPAVALGQVAGCIFGAGDEEAHGTAEAAGSRGVFTELFKERSICVVGQREALG